MRLIPARLLVRIQPPQPICQSSGVAQPDEHVASNREGVGSSPTSARDCVAPDKAFSECSSVVGRLVWDQKTAGSIPATPTTFLLR